MNETITVVDPGWDWAFTALMLAPSVLCIAVALIFMVIGFIIRGRYRKRAMFAWMRGFLWGFLGTGVFLGGLGAGIAGESRYKSDYNDSIAASLSESGFENITLNNDGSKSRADGFTASRDGDYFAGKLVLNGDNTYIIVPLAGTE